MVAEVAAKRHAPMTGPLRCPITAGLANADCPAPHPWGDIMLTVQRRVRRPALGRAIPPFQSGPFLIFVLRMLA
jgi:hypothetical protein